VRRLRFDLECEDIQTIGVGPDGEPITKLIRKRKVLTDCQARFYFVWDIFEDADGSQVSTYINYWIMGLIIFSAVIAVIETIPAIHKTQKDIWFGLECFFVINFSIEFISRAISCPSTWTFVTNAMNIVDLVAIVPFYLDIILAMIAAEGEPPNFSFLRILRLSRAARLIKLGKYSQGIRLVTNAMEKSLDALQLFGLVLTLVLVVFSSGIYYTERGDWIGSVCPAAWYSQFTPGFNATTSSVHCLHDKYYRTDIRVGKSNQIERYPSVFQSIPQSFWWTIVTLTTVGYGDMFPYTGMGKVVGVMTMIVGLIMLALPLSIIGTNFIEERAVMIMEKNRKEEESRLAELEAEPDEGRMGNKKEVNLRRDLRELLAKADQLYDSTGYMNESLKECNSIVESFQATMVGRGGVLFNPSQLHGNHDSNGGGSAPSLEAVAREGSVGGPPGSSETGTGTGSGGGTGSQPTEQSQSCEADTSSAPSISTKTGPTAVLASVCVEMTPAAGGRMQPAASPEQGSLGLVGQPWYKNRVDGSSTFAVRKEDFIKLKHLCLNVMKRAIEEMQMLDPHAEMPEMPAQLIELLQTNEGEIADKSDLWADRAARYAKVEGKPPTGADYWSPRGRREAEDLGDTL